MEMEKAMTPTSDEKLGSFRALRDRHLPLFEHKAHRHDRGWPHPPPGEGQHEPMPRQRWRTIGIFHFRHGEEDEG